jgi:hypothetical protein
MTCCACTIPKSLDHISRMRSDSHPLQAPTTISDPTCRPPHPKTNTFLNACTTPSPHSSPSNFAYNANSNNNSSNSSDIDIDTFPKSNNNSNTTLNTTPDASAVAESFPPFDYWAAVVGPYEKHDVVFYSKRGAVILHVVSSSL